MEKILKPIFFLLIVFLAFEGGFYIGIIYQESVLNKQEVSVAKDILSPAGQNNNFGGPLFSQMFSFQPKFKSKDGLSVPSAPAITISDWASFSYTLINSDMGSVKEAGMSVVYQGKIVKLEKNINDPFTKKITNSNFYLLSLENTKTGVVNSIYVDFDSNHQKPDDFHIGDNVEVYKTLSFIDKKRTEQIKILN